MASRDGRRAGLWLLAGFFIFLLLFTVLAWTLNRLLLGAAPAVTRGTVLEVSLQGALAEIRPPGPFAAPLTVLEADRAIREAADDERVQAVILDVGPLVGGLAKLQEIRSAVHSFRDAGKPVVALLEVGGGLDLFAAAAADHVVQVPAGQLVLGFLVQQGFYRDLLDGIGVRFEAFHTGPYKTAMDPWTRRRMSDAQREMQESLLDSVYSQWIEAVAEDRGLDPRAVREGVDRGLLTAHDAQRFGFVDQLGYRNDVDAWLEERLGSAPRRMGVRQYLRAGADSGGWFGVGPSVALIHVVGTMVPGDVDEGIFGGGLAGGETIAGYLREARRDADVRAIVVRIDSPGGAASAAAVIGREVGLAAEQKPVIVSMSDVAASGGYWIAAPGSHVVADGATYTGSIGVVAGRIGLTGTYEMLGIDHTVLKRGENADILADAVPLDEGQRRIFEENVARTYEQFIEIVGEGRGLSPDAVREVAQGRVWTGEQAVARGLVDEIGGLRQAILRARADAGLPADASVDLRVYPPRRSFLEELAALMGGWSAASRTDPRMMLPARLGRLLEIEGSGRLWTILQQPLPVAVR